jgi:hypothetical protein
MANTYTPTYNLIQPEVGADTNAWGTHVNTDLGTIDTHMLSRALTTSQTAAGPMVFGQTLRVNGAVTFDSTALVTGNTTLSGTLATAGAATFSSTAAVTGAATFGSTVAVTGTATFNGASVFNGTATVQTPTISGHATTKAYVDSADALKLNLTGGTLTGNLSIVNSTTEMAVTLGSSGGYYFGNATLAGFKNSGGTARVSWNISTGDFTAAGNVTAYSDAKLKENVKTIENAVDLVNQMRGVYYDRIDTGEAGVGVIAQEMRDVVPEVVVENDGTLAVAYGNLVGVLIEAVKELSNKVAALEAR